MRKSTITVFLALYSLPGISSDDSHDEESTQARIVQLQEEISSDSSDYEKSKARIDRLLKLPFVSYQKDSVMVERDVAKKDRRSLLEGKPGVPKSQLASQLLEQTTKAQTDCSQSFHED